MMIAILQQEPEAQQLAGLIAADRYRLVSAVSHLESAIVIGSRYGDTGKARLEALLRTHAITIVPVQDEVSPSELICRGFVIRL